MKRLLFTAAVLLFAVCAAAADTAGVELPQTMTVGENELVLNGAGLRKKFVIKVYAGGLYLPSKTSDAADVLNTDDAAVIRMVMIYDDIAPEKMKETWEEGFQANVADTAPLKDRIEMMTSWFTEAAREGDIYDIVYNPADGCSLIINGEKKGTVEGADFKKAIFSVWLGEKPADKKLKAAMLGE